MKPLYLLLAVCLLVTSCKKDSTDEDLGSASIAISGVRDADLTLSSNASYSMPLTVTSTNGAQQNVNLSAEDLPGGVSASFSPARGATPFNTVATFRYDFTGSGGIHPVKIVGYAGDASRAYRLNLTLDYYRGWRLGDSTYYKTDLYKDPGNVSTNPNIRVLAVRSGILTINFGLGRSLPTANKTYKITNAASAADDIQISVADEPSIYVATGVGGPTGTFTFDTLGRFTFKCTGVEMSDGVHKKLLDCSFSE